VAACEASHGGLPPLPEVMEVPQPPLEEVPQPPQVLQPPQEVENVVSDGKGVEMMQLAKLADWYFEIDEPVIPACDVQEVDEDNKDIVQLAVVEDPASRYCLTGSEAWDAWVDEWYFQTYEPDQEDTEMVDAWKAWAHEFYFETDEGEYLDVEGEEWDAEFEELDGEQVEEECSEVDEDNANCDLIDEGNEFPEEQ